MSLQIVSGSAKHEEQIEQIEKQESKSSGKHRRTFRAESTKE